jgi:hypothetical protein
MQVEPFEDITEWLGEWRTIVYHQMGNFSAISWWEQISFDEMIMTWDLC